MTRGRRITDGIREAIVNLWQSELSTYEISRYMGVPLRTVQRIISHAKYGPSPFQKKKYRRQPAKMNEEAVRVSA
jgi:hypothetical protein